MRTRLIDPGFFKNEKLAELSPLHRLFFEGLWCEADKNGCFKWRPKRLKVEILPYDECDPEQLLDDLKSAGFLTSYETESHGLCGHITKFLNWQSPHYKEKDSDIPIPTLNQPQSNVKSTLNQRQSNVDVTLPTQVGSVLTETVSQTETETVLKTETVQDWVDLIHDRLGGAIKNWGPSMKAIKSLAESNASLGEVGQIYDWVLKQPPDNFHRKGLTNSRLGNHLRDHWPELLGLATKKSKAQEYQEFSDSL